MKNQEGFVPIIIAVVVFLGLMVAGGGYFIYKDQQHQKNFEAGLNDAEHKTPGAEVNINNSNTFSPPPAQPQASTPTVDTSLNAQIKVPVKVASFFENLSSCTPSKTTFVHPITGQTLNKKIVGVVGGKCDYIEGMPNNGKMECKFSLSDTAAMAKYYSDVANAQSVSTDVTLNSNGEQKTTYTMNGKVVSSPLQEAINNGTCVITGY